MHILANLMAHSQAEAGVGFSHLNCLAYFLGKAQESSKFPPLFEMNVTLTVLVPWL